VQLGDDVLSVLEVGVRLRPVVGEQGLLAAGEEIGRASCRERV